jgi:hypothetical protein
MALGYKGGQQKRAAEHAAMRWKAENLNAELKFGTAR